MEEISADEFLQNIILGLKPLLDEKNVTVYLESEDTYIKIEYDLFKTLLLNLIDNSIKAGSNEIWISGKKNDNNYCIDITDNGRGIPVSELDRITEAFYTVDKSRSRKQHGIGLGLTLAAKIAELHGNPLKFSSEEGVGTVVKIILDYTNTDFL